MNGSLREHWIEAAAGLAVVLLAAWFISFAAARTSGAVGSDSYALKARFPNIAGVGVGTEVRVSGMKVGSVTSTTLDPKTFQALVTLNVASDLRLPADSSAAITSEGILGGSFIALIPGGDTAMLKAGDEIIDTQGAMDMMGLIGSIVNQSGGSDSAPAAAKAPGAAPGAAPPPAATEPAVEPAIEPAVEPAVQ